MSFLSIVVIVTSSIPLDLNFFFEVCTFSSSSFLFKNLLQILLEFSVGDIVIWRFERKAKDHRNTVSFSLDDLIERYEVLIHLESLFHLSQSQVLLVPSQNFSDEDVIEIVDFDHIKQKHVHEVLKQSELSAVLLVLKHVDDLSRENVELLIDHEDVFRFELLSVIRGVGSPHSQKWSFATKFDHALKIVAVLLGEKSYNSLCCKVKLAYKNSSRHLSLAGKELECELWVLIH